MTEPHLHLDADTSRKSLWKALLERGHDVTRTPNEWMALDASDEQQLLGAAAQRRCIFTFNIRDFIALARKHPNHSGILLSSQKPLPELLTLLERFFCETEADEMKNQVRWLNDWKEEL